MGRLAKVVDVTAMGGSSRPDHLASIVPQAFESKPSSADGTAGTRIDMRDNLADPYHVLGANKPDSAEDIKRKYKQMIMQYHPDRVAQLGQKLKDLAAKETTEINCAFEVIRRLRGF
jgi:DnaJ-domain-containing protein 1